MTKEGLSRSSIGTKYGGKNRHHMILSLPPMDDVPTAFTLVPADTNRQGMTAHDSIKKLTKVSSMGALGQKTGVSLENVFES